MSDNRREPVQFLANTPFRVTFDFDGGKEFTDPWGNLKTAYSVNGTQVVFADEGLAAKVNFCEPRRGNSLWITKRQIWNGNGKRRKPHSEWQVSAEEPGVVQRNGYQQATAAADMGIEETQLERELRESREIKERAKLNQQAKANVAVMPTPPALGDAVDSMLASDAAPTPQAVERKPPQVARPNWYEPVVTQTKQLVDALAEIRLHAERHGQRVSFDDCEKLLVTCLIGKQRQRA